MGATSLLSLSIAFRSRPLTGRRVKLIVSWLALGICVPSGWGATAQTDPTAGLIVPGTSIARLKLGSNPSAFQTVFSKRSGSANSAEIGTVGEGCPDKVYYWNDLKVNTSKIDAYFRNGQITQISAFGPSFFLSNGLRTGSTEQSVEHAYPKGRMYVLMHSASKVNGVRDLHYWVDKGAGIAFELDWSQNKKQRFVGSIDIFTKEVDFRPEGCISPPQRWQTLKQNPHRPS